MGEFVNSASVIDFPRFLSKVSFAFLIVALFWFTGCGEPIPELAQVTGTVTMNGKPLPGVGIAFSPDPSTGHVGRTSRGLTDADGKYTLTYRTAKGTPAPGASVGQHLVSVSDVLCIESRDKPLPYRFSLLLGKASSSPFKEVVSPGENQIDFDLTDYPNR
jgi:hypothetical protein